MYRQYENPHELELALKRAKDRYNEAIANDEDGEVLLALHDDVEELEQRLNFAIQDMESEEE